MSTYWADQPEFLSEALASVCRCTLRPQEVIMVLDGPVPEQVRSVIATYQQTLSLRVLPLEKNGGLGPALAFGLDHCQHELVARFDTDDICMPDRFERQLDYMLHHPEIDACSSAVLEFEHSIDEPNLRLKSVPTGPDTVARYARWRNPLNHMSVVFRKSKVLSAGSYQDDRYFEDYALWVRMLLNGSRLDNLAEPTVWARAGSRMLARRGGWAYVRREISTQCKFRSWGFINLFEVIRNISCRTLVRFMPSLLRGKVYSSWLRNKP